MADSPAVTRAEAQAKKDRAVRFVRDYLKDEEHATALEDEDLESWAAGKKLRSRIPGGGIPWHMATASWFNGRNPGIVNALAPMDETVLDDEIVALDAEGKPDFNTLQDYV